MKKIKNLSLTLFIIFTLTSCSKKQQITIVTFDGAVPRIAFGAEKLSESLSEAGYRVKFSDIQVTMNNGVSVVIGELQDENLIEFAEVHNIVLENPGGSEGFAIKSSENVIIIAGSDASGALYGCLELIERVKSGKKLPENPDITDKPEMVMRGTCVGLQKMTYLPGRKVYEYPYTPENFPWFYDKEHWIEYLNMMVENRYNSLYLWNGHPFASLVRLEDYPYAVEVDDETFQKNEEIFAFLTEEADKRGIWVIQMFYNIIVSQPFAEKHELETQSRNRPIIPVIADYTRKSVAAFIEKYPNVGLLVTLGEAMSGIDNDIKWFTETIIPGVKDGLQSLGRTDEPPIILRGHDTNPKLVMEAALPIYKNLYTTHKYNGESLTTYEPRGRWAEIHQGLSSLGSVHISNVHILANLEPFRYGSPDFIQKSMVATHEILGANGLHLYPQTSYWDWPYTADNTTPRTKQIDRDWIWYETWARYAWNAYRDRDKEIDYWAKKLGDFYGCGNYGHEILTAYEETGEIAPKLLRRFGISDGNRQTLTLGMFMSQLVNPYKWNVYSSFYESNGPEGEILIDYVAKKWNNEPVIGETPTRIIEETVLHGQKAVDAIEKAAPNVKKNIDEFNRLRNDVSCYLALANHFSEKVKAAMYVLSYTHSNEIADLENAVPHLERSVDYYRELANLTKDTYLYANSMQTWQRRIPIGSDDGKNKTWEELLLHYEEELANFKNNIQMLKSAGDDFSEPTIIPFHKASVKLLNDDLEFYPIRKNQKIYIDTDHAIQEFAEELVNLSGIRLSSEKQQSEGTIIRFESEKPVKVVVGYFNGHSSRLLSPPSLETDATANDRGQADIKLANALDIPGLHPVNIYTYHFEPGVKELILGKGMVLVLGFMDAEQDIRVRDAGLGSTDRNHGIDWLFY